METGKVMHGKYYFEGLKVRPVLRGPAELAETLRDVLRNHTLHLVGRTTVDGRAAIEFAGRTTDATAPEEHLYFDPTTHLPFEDCRCTTSSPPRSSTRPAALARYSGK